MTAPLRPDATPLYGSDNWVLIMTVASALYIPTAVEYNAASSLDYTDIIFADSAVPTQSTNLVQQERRYGDTARGQFVGEATVAGGEMHYAINPQGIAGSDGVKFYEKLPTGLRAFLANRRGIGKAVAAVAGQFVDCYPVQFGRSFPDKAGDGETSEAAMRVTFAVTTPNPAIRVALA